MTTIVGISRGGFSWTAVILLAGLLLALYTLQINLLTQKAYTTARVESEVQRLSKEAKELELRHTDAALSQNLPQLARKFSFEKAERITYITVIEPVVARTTE